MLTTEKLFRGDTEFALMEKVRKADVTPPSKFNRRVTPELDAMVLKALARDVADRYQSGAAFAQDLRQLLGNYRFDPSELKELLRSLFRAGYQKEVEELQSCLAVGVAPMPGPPDGRGRRDEQLQADEMPEVSVTDAAAVEPAARVERTVNETAPRAADKAGFWSRLKAKFGKDGAEK